MLYIILLIVILLFIMFALKKTDDFEMQLTLYENQKYIIANQHAQADALILIMKLIIGPEMMKYKHDLGKFQEKIDNLPN